MLLLLLLLLLLVMMMMRLFPWKSEVTAINVM